MKKIPAAFAVLSVVLLMTAGGFAQPAQRIDRGKARMQRPPSRILFALKAHQEELNVTEDQLKQIENIVFSFEEKQIAMKSQASSNRLEMKKLMSDRDNVNYDQIKSAFLKAAEHRADMFVSRLKLHEEVKKVLTPEQQEALKSMRLERFKTRRDLRGQRSFERHPRFRDRFEDR
jgi:Spy/CpxP family protein refolding chaperone